ncbi:MAG: carboxylesterase [Gammaproteobacteria bacterium]|nr:carboxylesterase [Gammaproteobacteria bacterium]MYD75556.1 carboxylesterase [Gammaproteobacteria bacterium]MYJ53037.1 carboxylesterase [Gammaproteobacteria bacterium]
MDPADNTVDFIEIQIGTDPDHAVIWLHGLGADGNDFVPVVPELGLDRDKAVRFVFPHAPMRPITVNGGMVMRGWYDISDLPVIEDHGIREDREGLLDSQRIVRQLIEQENRRGIPTGNIILAGFSQGGAIALYAGLRMEESLAGVIALSTYLPDSSRLELERSEANAGTPIFYAHGVSDPLINISAAMRSRNILEELGYLIEWQTYPMPHSVHPEEIRHIGAFINRLFSR